MRLVWGTVLEVQGERAGLQRLLVQAGEGAGAPAVSYPSLSGACAVGDQVLLNTTAVDLALGTGGSHVVVARGRAADAPAVSLDDPSGGHIMKLRYTPLQRDVLAVESPESPSHDALKDAADVGGMPVVCCGLHSQVSIVAAAIKERVPGARIAYVMTDEAALPLALSELAAACLEAGLLDLTVTCGQAFGGMLEAVTLHSGLVAARIAGRADVAIVAIGPGVVGTGTALGHGGIAQGEAINAASVVGGRPIAALRISFADARDRHRGVSHHSLTALSRIALARADVALPCLCAEQQAVIDADLAAARIWDRHTRADAPCELPDTRGVSTRSMGRAPADDPAFFLAATAAGAVAAGMLLES